jgi:L-asparaginase/beta-aspartyl-peptidase (threonine type)
MWAIGIHGGAAPLRGFRPEGDVATLGEALAVGIQLLEQGAGALDVVENTIRLLEDSGRFIAGKGACPNSLDEFELDAAICDGSTRKVGSIAAVSGVYPPISIARSVMDNTNNVLLVGLGARSFALSQGFPAIEDPASFFTPSSSVKGTPDGLVHGTVGAVVLDSLGKIAAGTSTGGTIGKRSGRVGDTPIVGCGTWADGYVGVSCTGQGEFFLRTAAAHSVSAKYREGAISLDDALKSVLREIAELGGEGGLISVDVKGEVGYVFNSEGMRIAVADSTGLRRAFIATTSI